MFYISKESCAQRNDFAELLSSCEIPLKGILHMFEQTITKHNSGMMGSLVWQHHVSSLHHSSLNLPDLQGFVSLTQVYFSHGHIWALCVLHLSAGKQTIPPHECGLDISNHSCTQEDESQRSFLFALSLQVLARLALTRKAETICISFVFLFCFFFCLYAPTASLWLTGVKPAHLQSAPLLYFQRRNMVTNILRCWAPSGSGLQHRAPEWISLVAVEDLRVGL